MHGAGRHEQQQGEPARESHRSRVPLRGARRQGSYGRSKGVVFHDTRHSAVTNFYASGISEPVAMTITGHADPTVLSGGIGRRPGFRNGLSDLLQPRGA